MVTKIRKNSKILEGRFSFSRCSVAKVSRFKKCPRTDGFTRVSARITTRAGGRIPFSCVIFSSSPLSFFFFFFCPFDTHFQSRYFTSLLPSVFYYSFLLFFFFFSFCFLSKEKEGKSRQTHFVAPVALLLKLNHGQIAGQMKRASFLSVF